MPRKKKVEKTSKGAPLWMVTYGDMITLVLCFFILLFAYSTMDYVKWKQVVSSLQGSIGVLDGGETLNELEFINDGADDEAISDTILTSLSFSELEDLEELVEIVQKLQEEMQDEIEQEQLTVRLDERGVLIRLKDSLLFESGRAVIQPEGLDVLNDLSNTLRDVDRYLRVEGHTDNVPTDQRFHQTNWELSADRATNVLRYLIESGGVDPFRISGGIYGEYYPIASNQTPETRQNNRRVDIIILRGDLAYTEERVVLN